MTKMGDIYGRKPIYMLGLAMNFVLVASLIVSTNPYLVYTILFFMGISVTARYYVGLTYNLEMATDSAQVWVTTIYFMAESFISLFICYYFATISKYWIPLMYPNLVLTVVGFMFLIFMPESPRYLVAKKQYNAARVVFTKIAKINGAKVDTDNFVFEGELANAYGSE